MGKPNSFTFVDSNSKITWARMVAQLLGSRELIYSLIYRDIAVKYRQSILGYIWAVLPQLVTVTIFTFLVRYRVIDMGQTDMPYVIHALWSISVWQLFAATLVGCTNSLVNAGTLVTKSNFPKESLVIASIGQPIIDFCIRLVPTIVVMWWLGYAPDVQAVWIPVVLIGVMLLSLGLGFFMAITNLVLRDIGNAVSMLMTFGMFLSPILYPPPVQGLFTWVNVLNPFSPLLITTQELLSGSPLSYPVLLSAVWLGSVLVFLLGWRVFCVALPRICERA